MNRFRPFAVILLIMFSFSSQAQNISQWRGPNRDGIYVENKLLKIWPEEGPELIWYNDSIGDGYGSLVVTKEMLYVNGEMDSMSYLYAFDLHGKLCWKSPNGKEFTGTTSENVFPGARSTPTVYDDLVYSCSSNGRIACFEIKTGKEKWAKEMVGDLNGAINYFGYSESLMVDNNYVYCFPGGAKNNVAALDRFTGKTVWTSKALSDTSAYCSPMIINLPSRNVLVNFTSHYILGIDSKTGEFLWSQKQDSVKSDEQCNTPIFSDGFLYYISGDGNGAVKLDLSNDGKSINSEWRDPYIKNYISGFVKINNHLFTQDNKNLKCLDINNGQVVDSLNGTGGRLIYADGMLYTYATNGSVNLIKLTDTKMEMVSSFKIKKGTREHLTHPVISNGILYLRHGRSLMAFNINRV